MSLFFTFFPGLSRSPKHLRNTNTYETGILRKKNRKRKKLSRSRNQRAISLSLKIYNQFKNTT